jgi:hypothetical protein
MTREPRAARVAQVLDDARADAVRPSPLEALEALRVGALLVDNRTPVQRERQGDLPGALVIDRTVLE